MSWTLVPREVGTSAVMLPLTGIHDDVQLAVEEAYEAGKANPTKFYDLPTFANDAQRDGVAQQIRSYCAQRQAGRLSAFMRRPAKDAAGNTAIVLSIRVVDYEKKSRSTTQETATPGITSPAAA
jgi:hypothetical protein